MKMSPEAQRIAIAEFCGWRWEMWGKNQVWVMAPSGAEPNWSHNGKVSESIKWPIAKNETAEQAAIGVIIRSGPDYLSDLNAIHEAEKRLNEHQFFEYECHLSRLVYRETSDADWESGSDTVWKRYSFCATPPQRSEALIRTIGKWVEE